LVARIRHPNVVPTIDVVATEGEVFVVMEYVHGESLARLRSAMAQAGRVADPRIVASVISGVLHGLHAAHEAKSEVGQPLNIVHRDVSPQNILVGIEGISRVLDFGVAKAIGRVQSTREGQIKGKLAYMAPEQLQGGHVTRRADIYAVAAVTWEAFTGQRLFSDKDTGALVTAILSETILPPSAVSPHVAGAFDRVVMRGLERDPARRYSTAREMALDLERCAGIVSPSEVGTWVERWAGPTLAKRAALMAEIEATQVAHPAEPTTSPDPTAGDASIEVAVDVPDDALGHADGRSALSHVTASSRARQIAQSKQHVALVASIAALGLAAALVSVLLIHNRAEKPVVAKPTTVVEPTHPPIPAASATTFHVETPTVDVASLPVATGGPDSKRPQSGVPSALHSLGQPPASVTKPTKPDCSPPFVVDDKGRKHYKAACL
jgi:serine/threonine-protein kinase